MRVRLLSLAAAGAAGLAAAVLLTSTPASANHTGPIFWLLCQATPLECREATPPTTTVTTTVVSTTTAPGTAVTAPTSTALPPTITATTTTSPPNTAWFQGGPASVFTPISASAPVYPSSSSMAQVLDDKPFGVLSVSYGTIVWNVADTDPLRTFCVTHYPFPTLGSQFAARVPDRAFPSTGSDHHMGRLNRATGDAYEAWLARKAITAGCDWSVGSATRQNLYTGKAFLAEGTTGSGSSAFFGLRADELAACDIRHALPIALYSLAGPTFVAPATRSDGKSSSPLQMPEGAKIRINPAFDVNRVPAGPMRCYVQAMKTYGWVVADNGGVSDVPLIWEEGKTFPFGTAPDWYDPTITDLRLYGVTGDMIQIIDWR